MSEPGQIHLSAKDIDPCSEHTTSGSLLLSETNWVQVQNVFTGLKQGKVRPNVCYFCHTPTLSVFTNKLPTFWTQLPADPNANRCFGRLDTRSEACRTAENKNYTIFSVFYISCLFSEQNQFEVNRPSGRLWGKTHASDVLMKPLRSTSSARTTVWASLKSRVGYLVSEKLFP